MSQSDSDAAADYRLFDQEEKLGSPPWRRDDPKVVAWEKAHGHDVRLKCYPEFGCLVEAELTAAVIKAAREMDAAYAVHPAIRRKARANLRAALDALDGEVST